MRPTDLFFLNGNHQCRKEIGTFYGSTVCSAIYSVTHDYLSDDSWRGWTYQDLPIDEDYEQAQQSDDYLCFPVFNQLADCMENLYKHPLVSTSSPERRRDERTTMRARTKEQDIIENLLQELEVCNEASLKVFPGVDQSLKEFVVMRSSYEIRMWFVQALQIHLDITCLLGNVRGEWLEQLWKTGMRSSMKLWEHLQFTERSDHNSIGGKQDQSIRKLREDIKSCYIRDFWATARKKCSDSQPKEKQQQSKTFALLKAYPILCGTSMMWINLKCQSVVRGANADLNSVLEVIQFWDVMDQRYIDMLPWKDLDEFIHRIGKERSYSNKQVTFQKDDCKRYFFSTGSVPNKTTRANIACIMKQQFPSAIALIHLKRLSNRKKGSHWRSDIGSILQLMQPKSEKGILSLYPAYKKV